MAQGGARRGEGGIAGGCVAALGIVSPVTPVEYSATIVVGAALLIASYRFPSWVTWGVGLAMVLLPILGIPQWLNSKGPKK